MVVIAGIRLDQGSSGLAFILTILPDTKRLLQTRAGAIVNSVLPCLAQAIDLGSYLDNEDLQSLYLTYELIVKGSKGRSERSSLMNVGRRVDYAVRALSYLAGQPAGTIVSRADIEKSQDVPSFYLSKIMKDLVAGGLVQSHIGSKGGFNLAKGPGAISIKDVYETVERPLVLMECLEQGVNYCSYCAVCSQKSVWEKAQEVLSDFLASVTIADVADRQGLKSRLSKVPLQKAV